MSDDPEHRSDGGWSPAGAGGWSPAGARTDFSGESEEASESDPGKQFASPVPPETPPMAPPMGQPAPAPTTQRQPWAAPSGTPPAPPGEPSTPSASPPVGPLGGFSAPPPTGPPVGGQVATPSGALRPGVGPAPVGGPSDPADGPAWGEGYYEALDNHKGPKGLRPRRSSGMRLLGGVGLLGILAAVVILGVLGVRALSDLGDSVEHVAETASTDGQVPAGPTSGHDRMCAVDLRTLKTAVAAYRAEWGAFPPDQATLVEANMLERPSTLTDFEIVDGQPAFRSIGECA